MARDDWSKIEKTTVNITKIIHRNPAHENCDLCIKPSKKNPLFVGLYCVQHDHWLTWLNDQQIEFMKNLDDSIIDLTKQSTVGSSKAPSIFSAPRTRL